jgi:hypothetical protein
MNFKNCKSIVGLAAAFMITAVSATQANSAERIYPLNFTGYASAQGLNRGTLPPGHSFCIGQGEKNVLTIWLNESAAPYYLASPSEKGRSLMTIDENFVPMILNRRWADNVKTPEMLREHFMKVAEAISTSGFAGKKDVDIYYKVGRECDSDWAPQIP